jgi:hypothetical protein
MLCVIYADFLDLTLTKRNFFMHNPYRIVFTINKYVDRSKILKFVKPTLNL